MRIKVHESVSPDIGIVYQKPFCQWYCWSHFSVLLTLCMCTTNPSSGQIKLYSNLFKVQNTSNAPPPPTLCIGSDGSDLSPFGIRDPFRLRGAEQYKQGLKLKIYGTCHRISSQQGGHTGSGIPNGSYTKWSNVQISKDMHIFCWVRENSHRLVP